MKKMIFSAFFISTIAFANENLVNNSRNDSHGLNINLDKIVQPNFQEEIDLVDSMVKKHYGDHMKIDTGFDIGCVNYVKGKIESKKMPWADGQAHYHFSISSPGGIPRKESIEEIIKGRFEYLDSLGLPLTISRYYIKVIVEGGTTYLILALDN